MKKVRFDPNVKILNIYAWKFAYREARKSDWSRIVADRCRFEDRKEEMKTMLDKIGFFTRKY